MHMQRAEGIFGAMTICMGLVFGVQSWTIIRNAKVYGEGWFPFLAALILIVCGLFLLRNSFMIGKRVLLSIDYWFIGLVIVGAIIFCLLIMLVGFTFASFFYLAVMLKLLGQSWKSSLVLSVFLSAGLYIVFVKFLTVYFPPGHLLELIGHPL